jgi:Ca-activated chloride channel family protein
MAVLLWRAIVLSRLGVFSFVFLIYCGLSAIAPAAQAQFSNRVNLVEVYATVTGAGGQAVGGLTQDDFEVEEDGVAQEIRAFAVGEMPLALAIAVDRSFSIKAPELRQTTRAVAAMLTALRVTDLAMLVAIGSQTEVVAPLSTDRRAALEALPLLEPWGTTPLFDATRDALGAIQPASGRRALVLLSDGRDRYSETTAEALLTTIREGDVLVYPVTLGKARADVFSSLAAVSGGRAFQVADLRTLPGTLQTIARELRTQYLVGYVPAREGSARPGWRAIRLTLKRPGLTVRARQGYVAR